MNHPFKIGQPRFVSVDEVLELHKASINLYGGAEGVLDPGMLESSVAHAQSASGNTYLHEFPFQMAAAYGFHIAKNHPFRDGNKRAAFAAMAVFLHMNGWELTVADDDAADLILGVLSEGKDKQWLASELESGSRLRPSLELRDFFMTLNARDVELVRAAGALGSDQDALATVQDAAIQMPIIGDLIRDADHYRQAGDEHAVSIRVQQVVFLTFLHRAAEDLGYEW